MKKQIKKALASVAKDYLPVYINLIDEEADRIGRALTVDEIVNLVLGSLTLDETVQNVADAIKPAATVENPNPKSIDYLLTQIPKDWPRALITWPGYNKGKLLAPFRVDLYHGLSSGGQPMVSAYGPTLAETLQDAIDKAEQKEKFNPNV